MGRGGLCRARRSGAAHDRCALSDQGLGSAAACAQRPCHHIFRYRPCHRQPARCARRGNRRGAQPGQFPDPVPPGDAQIGGAWRLSLGLAGQARDAGLGERTGRGLSTPRSVRHARIVADLPPVFLGSRDGIAYSAPRPGQSGNQNKASFMIRARHSLLILAGTSLLMATACTDPAMVNGNDPRQKTRQGAILGGLLGAGLGAAVSEDKGKGAIIGGALGAAGGAAYGNMLDKQEAQRRQELDNDRIRITNTGDRLIVTMPQDILFDVDSASVRSGLRNDLMTVADSLRDYPDSSVQVVGHTDNTGGASYNQQLSERRANAVADVLMQGGVPFGRIQTFGRGENQPIADNLTDSGRAQNRRVEIVILPNAALSRGATGAPRTAKPRQGPALPGFFMSGQRRGMRQITWRRSSRPGARSPRPA